jgi:hypothetical protein
MTRRDAGVGGAAVWPNLGKTWARIGRGHSQTAVEHRTQPDSDKNGP